MNIKITKATKSRIDSVDMNNIPFGKVFSDHMFIADYIDGKWTNLEIKPIQNLSLHPSNLALHYGQSVFEGMKASVTKEGVPCLFRPEMHAKRINKSAARMCMPAFPEDLFVEAVTKLVGIEKNWIPPYDGSALYIRPFMFATDEFLGVRPSEKYKFIIMTLPVGPYYTKPVSLKAETEFVRAAIGGVGEAKAAGNYAASLYPAKLAQEQGFDQIMWLDAKEFKYIQEVGTMNIFFVIDGVIVTPQTDGAILKGITRDSFITIFKDAGYKVEERLIGIDEVFAAHADGKLQEVFGAGTAAVVSKVERIHHDGKEIKLDVSDYKIANLAYDTLTGLRNGTVEDKFGWVIPVEIMETV
ncbi:branched-chain amino acid aminotransferase [Portibacter lacus]|uniref:Branched-chain-amino-acid aminotransferase n=1 Tax=Portibacter lacus TaxID=1099794 RepID=A0AA37WEG7_9BACT|nr:branched-chain amino acid aminotransferase [Portibacter lacus]GLR17367.1 branched-chain-amino-acid aminotransferase 2 [Portibacter lacus]